MACQLICQRDRWCFPWCCAILMESMTRTCSSSIHCWSTAYIVQIPSDDGNGNICDPDYLFSDATHCYEAPADQWLEKRGLLVARLRLRRYPCSATHYLLGPRDTHSHGVNKLLCTTVGLVIRPQRRILPRPCKAWPLYLISRFVLWKNWNLTTVTSRHVVNSLWVSRLYRKTRGK